MGSKRKTRKQKVDADERRKIFLLSPAKRDLASPDENQPVPSQTTPSPTVDANKYLYLVRDIAKTGIVTALLITTQLILFFLLKKHIVILPLVKY